MANKQLQEMVNILSEPDNLDKLKDDDPNRRKDLIKEAADQAAARIPEIPNTKVNQIIVSLFGVRIMVIHLGERIDDKNDGWG